MLVKEYRILAPFDVDDFQRGHLYTTAEASKAETGGGEGVEVVRQEAFESDDLRPGEHLEGIFSHKIYRIKSKVPWLLQKMFPDAAFELHEESWNAYPYFKTIITNPGYMKKGFEMKIESLHLQDNGDSENPLNSSHPKREIININVWDEKYLKSADITDATDPRKVRSEKMEIGPLEEDWQDEEGEDAPPVMCAYKLVSVTFNWRGIGGQIEKTIHKSYPRLFSKFHREVYCLADKWWDMSLEEVREHEKTTAANLRTMLRQGKKRGGYNAATSGSDRQKK